MDDARNEVTSSIASNKMADVRDEALSSVAGRVRDRKKFFEQHINKQQRRENALVSQTQSSCAPPKTGFSMSKETVSPSFIEDRTDSESCFHKNSERSEPERKDFDKMGSEPSSSRVFHQKWTSQFDSETVTAPWKSFDQEPSFDCSDLKRTTILQNELYHTSPTVGKTAVANTCHSIERAKSLDRKMVSFNDIPSEEKGGKAEKESEFKKVDQYTGLAHDANETKNNPVSYDKEESEEDKRQTNGGDGRILRNFERGETCDELVRINKEPNPPTVKIQVTKKIDDQTSRTNSETKIDIDEMITEFQQASAKLSAPKHLPAGGRSGNRPIADDIYQKDDTAQVKSGDDLNYHDSSLSPNNVTGNGLDESHYVSHSKDKVHVNHYISPSESANDSIDSKGNSKATKESISSKSGIKLKGKGSGVGKMLKKAKKGMGKSVKNLTVKSASQISQLTSKVKNTMKSKSNKQSPEQSLETDQKNHIKFIDFFDLTLAEELVKDSKDETGIVQARQYLESGIRLLQNGVELKKGNDQRGSKEAIRTAHTYAYVGRQLAKQYLLRLHQENLDGNGANPTRSSLSENDDGMSVFEDFFLSFLQCVGPCPGDNTFEKSRLQVGETLEILSKLSEEEASVAKNRLWKGKNEEVVLGRKLKVEGAIAGTRDSAAEDNLGRMKDLDHDTNFEVHRFFSALRTFYEVDTNMRLSQIFLQYDQDKNDDDSYSSGSYMSESLSYNYSESLKFDHGRSFNTRSFASEGTTKEDQPSSSSSFFRGRKTKEESLAGGIRPGTTVVSISVKDKTFKRKKKANGNKKKKKQPSPRKWLNSGGRKQK